MKKLLSFWFAFFNEGNIEENVGLTILELIRIKAT